MFKTLAVVMLPQICLICSAKNKRPEDIHASSRLVIRLLDDGSICHLFLMNRSQQTNVILWPGMALHLLSANKGRFVVTPVSILVCFLSREPQRQKTDWPNAWVAARQDSDQTGDRMSFPRFDQTHLDSLPDRLPKVQDSRVPNETRLPRMPLPFPGRPIGLKQRGFGFDPGYQRRMVRHASKTIGKTTGPSSIQR